MHTRACNSVDREYGPGLDSALLVRGWPGVNGTTFRGIDDVAIYQHSSQSTFFVTKSIDSSSQSKTISVLSKSSRCLRYKVLTT